MENKLNSTPNEFLVENLKVLETIRKILKNNSLSTHVNI